MFDLGKADLNCFFPSTNDHQSNTVVSAMCCQLTVQ